MIFVSGVFLEYLIFAIIEHRGIVQHLDGFAHEVKDLFLLYITGSILFVYGDRVAIPLKIGVLTTSLFHLIWLVTEICSRFIDIFHVVIPSIFQMIGRVNVFWIVPLLVSLFSNKLIIQSLFEHLVTLFRLRFKSRWRDHEHGSFFVAVDLVLINVTTSSFDWAISGQFIGYLVDVCINIRHNLRPLLLLYKLPFGFLIDPNLRFLDLNRLRIVLFLTIALLFYEFYVLGLFWLRGSLCLISRECGKVVLKIMVVSPLTRVGMLELTVLSGLTARKRVLIRL